MNDEISRAGIGKDAVQSTLVAAAETLGKVTTIVVGAMREVAQALNEFGNELYEIQESARRAASDGDHQPEGPKPVD